MDDLDIALLTAFRTLDDRLHNCRSQREIEQLLAPRFARAQLPTLQRPIRPWSLCLRASDRRIKDVATSHDVDAESRYEPHRISLDHHGIRQLVRPLLVDWPDVRVRDVARRTGRSIVGLDHLVRKGRFDVRHYPASVFGRGKPVPVIHDVSPFDPNANNLAPPDPHWSTFWQTLDKRIHPCLELNVERVPIFRPDARPCRNGRGTRARGWQFLCPGRYFPIAEGITPPAHDPAQFITIRNKRYLHVPCARTCNRIFSPCDVWTIQHTFGITERSESRFDRKQNPPKEDPKPRFDAAGNPLPAIPALFPAELNDQFPDHAMARSFACHKCWKIRYNSLTDRNGWNNFIAHISGGMLFGHEVQKPADLEVRRKRQYRPSRRAHPRRDQLLALILSHPTFPACQYAKLMKISVATVNAYIKLIYRAANVHSKKQLLQHFAARPHKALRKSA